MSFVPLALDAGRALLSHYTRGSRSTTLRGRGRKSRNRRSSGLSRSRANVSSRVPTRSIMQGSFQGSIRNYYTIESAKDFYKSITRGDLLGDQFAALKTQFGECRVNSLRVYIQPDQSTSSSGSYAACLIDSTTSKAKTLTYGAILALPGSTSRKMYQPSGLHWKWTEPSDAEFVLSNSTTSVICDVYIATNGTQTISGDLIVDASVTLRSSPGAFVTNQLARMIEVHSWSQPHLEEALQMLTSKLNCLAIAPPPPLDPEVERTRRSRIPVRRLSCTSSTSQFSIC